MTKPVSVRCPECGRWLAEESGSVRDMMRNIVDPGDPRENPSRSYETSKSCETSNDVDIVVEEWEVTS